MSDVPAAHLRSLSAHGPSLAAPGVVERICFALVAHRCLELASKLAAVGWAAERVAIERCPSFDDQPAYAAIDFLLASLPEIAERIFSATTNLLNLSCHITFVDATSTYFEVDVADGVRDLEVAKGQAETDVAEGDDAPGPVEQATRRFNKHSKDHRPGLPQVVLGMAVTAEGVLVRCWRCPDTTSDQVTIRTIKDDLAGWQLNRVVWVASKVHGVWSRQPREWVFVKRILDQRHVILLARRGEGADHPCAAANVAALIEVVADDPCQRILNVTDPDCPNGRANASVVEAHLGRVWDEVLIDAEEGAEVGTHPWDSVPPVVLDRDPAFWAPLAAEQPMPIGGSQSAS